MPTIEDHSYLKICAQLASSLSISLSSAKRQVELAANRKGTKDLNSRKIIAEKLLAKALSKAKDKNNAANQLDKLLEVLAREENFMIED